MSRILRPYRVEMAVWLVFCGGLVTGIGVETDWGRQWSWPLAESEVASTAFIKPGLTDPFRLPPPDKFIDIALRPLFVVTRSPAPIPPPAEAPKPTMKKGQFILTGVTIVGEGKFVHLVEKTGNKSHVVAEGKEINGILVKEVTPDRVILNQYDDTELLILRPAKAPAALPATQMVPATQAAPARQALPASANGRGRFPRPGEKAGTTPPSPATAPENSSAPDAQR